MALVVGVHVNSLAAVPLASRDHLDLDAAYISGHGHSVRSRTFDARIWFAFRPGIAVRASASAWRAGKTEKHAAFGHVARSSLGIGAWTALARRTNRPSEGFSRPFDKQFEEIFKNKPFQAWRRRRLGLHFVCLGDFQVTIHPPKINRDTNT